MSWWEAFVWGDLDRRCPARPADRGLLLLDSLLHGGHLVCVVCARKPPREGLAALAARNKAHCQYTVKFWRQRVVIRHRPQRSSRPCGRRPREGAETAPLPAPFWCTIPVEPAHFDWRSRERPALALLAWEALSRDPMAGLRRIQAESIGTTINLILLAHFFAFSPSSARRRRSRSRNGRRRRRRLMAWIHPRNLIAISP